MHPILKSLLEMDCYVTIKYLGRKYVGRCKFSNHHIWIDLTGKDNIAKTFIHELLHLKFPNWSEEKVLRWENKLWETISHDTAELFYQKLYRCVHKGYEK